MADGTRERDIASARSTMWQLLQDGGGDIGWDDVAAALKRHQQALYGDYEVAIINALPHESAAVQELLGPIETVPSDRVSMSFDIATIKKNSGAIQKVVVAAVSGQGNTQAAMVVAGLAARLPLLRSVLLVGIAAGQPNPEEPERDVWLGDIVVGDAVIQYDHVKREPGKTTCRGENLVPPDADLLSYVRKMKAEMEVRRNSLEAGGKWSWETAIEEGVQLIEGAERPASSFDKHVPVRNYPFASGHRKGEGRPHLLIGKIGSGNVLLKDSEFRDDLHRQHKTIAYEMEGAGVAIAASSTSLRYLIIRGICDYADMDKEDGWQRYASVAAAGFCRVLLEQA